MNINPSAPLWVFFFAALIAFLSLPNLINTAAALILLFIGVKLSKFVEVREFNRLHNYNRPEDGKKRLNVGCGYWSYEGWINMDDNKVYDAKLINFEKPLPLKNGTIDEARIEMKLEFLGNPKFLLEEVSRVLKSGAYLTIFYSWTNFIDHKNHFDEDTFLWLDKKLLSSKHHTEAPKVDFSIEEITHIGGFWSWLFYIIPVKAWRGLWRSTVHEMAIKIKKV